jgi:hypothetical protein
MSLPPVHSHCGLVKAPACSVVPSSTPASVTAKGRKQAGFLSQRTWGILAVLVALLLIPYWMAKKSNNKTPVELVIKQSKVSADAKPSVPQAQGATTDKSVRLGALVPATDTTYNTPSPDRFGLSLGHGDLQGKAGLMVSICAGTPLDMGNPDKNQCNPIQGDSSCRTALPILCVLKDGSTAESAGLVNMAKAEGGEKPVDRGFDLYASWVGGTLGATAPVAGFVIGSLTQANARCVAELGSGWRMAELHNAAGSAGLGLVGKRGTGLTSQQTRHWVHVNDQKANCWDAEAK